jgi:hypothetical protein
MTRIPDNDRPMLDASLRRAAARAERVTRLRRNAALVYRRTQHPEEDFDALRAHDWSAEREAAREQFRRAHALATSARDQLIALEASRREL